MKIGLLWIAESSGNYAVQNNFTQLFKTVGANNGNLAFVESIRSQIDAEFVTLPWGVTGDRVNGKVDAVVFPCANQLGAHSDLGSLVAPLSTLDVPIIAIGLGAQANEIGEDITLTQGTSDWLNLLIENGRRFGIQNIYTRGPYTTEQIKRLTGADSFANGCPSHFFSKNPKLGEAIERNWMSEELPKRIAVAGGHESWGHVRTIEQQLVAMMGDPLYPGSYIVQSMEDMVKLSRGLFSEISDEKMEEMRLHIAPHYSLADFKTWALTYVRSYYDVYAWMDDLRRHDLLIGPRFHGAQLALQAERMACCITIDSRTEEMCTETGVPYLRAQDLTGPLTRKRLKDMLPFDGAAYDAFRAEKCGRYVGFLEKAGLKPQDYLKKIADA